MSLSQDKRQVTKADILGCKIDIITMQQALELLEQLIRTEQRQQIITLNAEIAYKATQDKSLQNIINSARLVTADGIGIVWAAKVMGYEIKERITGVDLLFNLCQLAVEKSWKFYLLGAAPGVADMAAQKLMEAYPGLQIVGTHHGYYKPEEMEKIIIDINRVQPDILLVGMGAPKQEYWIYENKSKLNASIMIGVGGSLDIAAGNKKRAPGFFIKMNLEWLYRLITEPSRIKRQVVLPLFALKVLNGKYLARFKDN
jgi:N-acetylglucosaminyldiphosphoundecaprenol N-acetyl-beta-D-mannosaminyltransferase